MRKYKPVFGTYRMSADTTAQAMRIADSYRARGWRCTTRGRRLVMTTQEEQFLDADTPGQLWQLDRSAHEVACREWLVPELRGGRRQGAVSAFTLEPGAAGAAAADEPGEEAAEDSGPADAELGARRP